MKFFLRRLVMKFVHIGDLHLGKVIHQYSLLDIQRELLFELLEFMNQEDYHELADEYIILFQGITKAIELCRQIGGKLEFLNE